MTNNVVNLAAYRTACRAKSMAAIDPMAPWFAAFGIALACFSAPIAVYSRLMLDTAERSLAIATKPASRT